MRLSATRRLRNPVGTRRASRASVPARRLSLLLVLAASGCALTAPFDPSLLPGSDGGSPGARERSQLSGRDVDAGAFDTNEPDGALGGQGENGETDAGAGGDGQGGESPGVEQGPCTPGDTRACYPGADGEAGTGICRTGTQLCEAKDGLADWGACDGARTPALEECGNGLDEDCDGETDEGCDEPAVEWCWFCSGIDLWTDQGVCALGSVPARADGSCPDGASRDVPECEPCLSCTVVQGFCETPECCGDWVDTQAPAEGCSCWGCPGQGTAGDVDTAVVLAEAAGLAFCEQMPAQYDSACGDSSNGCFVRSCGAAAACQ